MNIGFEAKRFFANRTGLGNYSRFVVNALSASYPENQYFLYTPTAKYPSEAEPIISRPCVHIVSPSRLYKLSTSLWRSWGVSGHSTMSGLHVYHGLSQELPIGLSSSIHTVVTVHDLIFYRFPQFYNALDVAIYKKKLSYAANRVDRIIAVSQQTKDDLVQFLGVEGKKIEVIHQGCHPNFYRKASPEEIAETKVRFRLPDDYILNVGTIEERKNLGLLIDALATLPKERRLPLVVVGQRGAYYEKVLQKVEEHRMVDDVLFLRNVPFSDFPAIYQGARAFVYPSRFEGFGIPLIEAIVSGIPVITSKGSCFHEAAGPGARYADPNRADELAHYITTVLSDEQLRVKMIAESAEYVKRFEPEVIAAQLNNLYHSL